MSELIIEKISQGYQYNTNFVEGYSNDDLNKIEQLYEILISGTLKKFLSELGKCDGGLIGDDPIVLYLSEMNARGFLMLQIGLEEDIYNSNFQNLCGQGIFTLAIESETQYFFLATKNENPDLVYRYDENEEIVFQTGLNLIEYLESVVKRYSENSHVICKGNLLFSS